MKSAGEISYAFLGSGHFAARCVELLSQWRKPSWIVTAPPKPAGRGNKLTPTPVEMIVGTNAQLNDVPLLRSASASSDNHVLEHREKIPVDFAFVVDFGQLIREPLLSWDAPIGCLNIHPSLLPLYRGAAPVQRALMNCEKETGVSVFKLAAGMDSGPILLQRAIAVGATDDTGALLEKAAQTGVSALIEYAENHPLQEWRFTPQDDAGATTAPKIRKEEERINWNRPADEVAGLIRALSPRPGAWTTIRDRRLRVFRVDPGNLPGEGAPGRLLATPHGPAVKTGTGMLLLSLVQAEGKKIQEAAEWWNGLRATEGECFV